MLHTCSPNKIIGLTCIYLANTCSLQVGHHITKWLCLTHTCQRACVKNVVQENESCEMSQFMFLNPIENTECIYLGCHTLQQCVPCIALLVLAIPSIYSIRKIKHIYIHMSCRWMVDSSTYGICSPAACINPPLLPLL
jgi:hypothetical protein